MVEDGGSDVLAVGVADRWREAVDAGALDEVDGHLQRLLDRCLVRSDVVLDPLDALDLALDAGARSTGLLNHLGGLSKILRDIELVRVEEHGVPAPFQAGADHLAVGAVIQVQRDGDVHIAHQRGEDAVQLVAAVHLHRLHRCLHDERRLFFD